MKKLLALCTFCFLALGLSAQTMEELKSTMTEKEGLIAAKEGEIAALKGEVDALKLQIEGPVIWTHGAFGTIGFNVTDLSNWVTAGNPNSRATNIMGSFNAFINKDVEKYFWRNSGAVNLGWQKLVVDKDNEPADSEFESTADNFILTSLLGYKLTDKLAMSALGEYRTTLINNFNNPGYLDIGVGFTYLPIKELVVVVHPLNYNFVFADEGTNFESSLGAKLVADYAKEVYPGFNYRSNLTSFISYSEPSDLSNFTWTNGLGFTAWKGIGVGLEYAMRLNKQETLGLNDDYQSYWIIGLTYNI